MGRQPVLQGETVCSRDSEGYMELIKPAYGVGSYESFSRGSELPPYKGEAEVRVHPGIGQQER